MIGRDGLALARLSIDFRPHQTSLQRLRDQALIDPHSEVLVKVAGAIVPPAVARALRVSEAIGVDQAPLAPARPGGALLGRDVGPAVTGGRIPHVEVGRRDVEVAAEHERVAGRTLAESQSARRSNHSSLVR